MSRIFPVFLLLFLAIVTTSFSQISDKKILYLKKIESYKRMRNTGFTMGGVGLVSTVVGVAMIAEESRKFNNGLPHDENKVKQGAICVLLGLPLTTAGTILGLIGTHKVRSYKNKFDGLSFDINYSPQEKGIVLKYQF